MSKYLVTGAAGFIGSTLVDQLLSNPENIVVGIDSFTDYYDADMKRSNLAGITTDRFRLIEASIAEADLASLLDEVEVVFHLAGQPGVRSSWGSEFGRYLEDNISATQLLLEASRSAPSLRRFVYASSSSVYGDAISYPTTESDRPAPVSPYGVSKLAAEHLATLYATAFAVPTISLRFFTVYGPRQRPDMAFRRFITDALSERPIHVYGDGTQIREFTFVSDIVNALQLAGGSDSAPGSVVNVSGGASVSVNEVIETLEQLLDRRIDVQRHPKVVGDVYRTGGSVERARELLGWTPSVSLVEGLRREVDWVSSTLDGRLLVDQVLTP